MKGKIIAGIIVFIFIIALAIFGFTYLQSSIVEEKWITSAVGCTIKEDCYQILKTQNRPILVDWIKCEENVCKYKTGDPMTYVGEKL